MSGPHDVEPEFTRAERRAERRRLRAVRRERRRQRLHYVKDEKKGGADKKGKEKKRK